MLECKKGGGEVNSYYSKSKKKPKKIKPISQKELNDLLDLMSGGSLKIPQKKVAKEKSMLGPLPDNEFWIERVGIKSESSNRIYIVAKNANTGKIHCSCPAGKTKKTCKHIKARLGIKPDNSFLDGYNTYDGARGNKKEWESAFGKSTSETLIEKPINSNIRKIK